MDLKRNPSRNRLYRRLRNQLVCLLPVSGIVRRLKEEGN